jgi:hypothetical protein
LDLERFQTIIRVPARAMFSAMGSPIFPSPMNPTFMFSAQVEVCAEVTAHAHGEHLR